MGGGRVAEAGIRRGWDADLQHALCEGLLTGYALVSPSGTCECAHGAAEPELVDEDGLLRPVAMALMALLAPAYGSGDGAPPSSVEAFGRKLILLRRTDWQVVALGHCRRVGVCLHRLPLGMLITTFDHTRMPNVVVAAVEKIAHRLKGTAPA